MHFLLTIERGYSFTTTTGGEFIRNGKGSICKLVFNLKQKMIMSNCSPVLGPFCKPPEGQMITTGDKRFRCPRALFPPDLMGLNATAIHGTTHNSIVKGDADIRGVLQRASNDTTKETGKWSATSIRITLTDWMVSGCSMPPNVVVREVMHASAPMFASLHLAHTEQPVSYEEGNFASEGTRKKP
ncbi:Actin-2 [Echinococcus granulosus]|uniref:Actin-2 n=1 Tax=Echinococcus granulosus TaxID=6210 RepID=W6U0U6_ECHGR|nr:Actin-2 [Echinococcus granulosus]EUB54668.1 Actin-2 [Echinococcus granulosus]